MFHRRSFFRVLGTVESPVSILDRLLILRRISGKQERRGRKKKWDSVSLIKMGYYCPLLAVLQFLLFQNKGYAIAAGKITLHQSSSDNLDCTCTSVEDAPELKCHLISST